MRTLGLLLLLAPVCASAAPTLGFKETFPTTISTWGGGATLSNPGSGGAGGASDGYLKVARSLAGSLATRSEGLEYHGDWIAANINKINLKLNDVGTNQNLSIHVAIGNPTNFWLCNTGFAPPDGAWGQFSVDLTDSTNWTHLINLDGMGFAGALRNADRLHIRHDTAPFLQSADDLAGDFGIDDIELTSSLIGVPMPLATGVRPIELSAPYPNPSRGAIVCAFEAFSASTVRIAIFDAAGRLVRTESLSGTGPGRRTWMWDGLDSSGRVAPAGAYRVRVTDANGGESRPFIKID